MTVGRNKLGWQARPFFTQVHRYAGLATAFFLIVAGLTGAVLAFYHELDHALNPGLFRVQERPAPVLGPNALVAGIQAAYPDARVSLLELHRQAGESVHVRLIPRDDPAGKPYVMDVDEVYLDPYDGRILGRRKMDAFRIDRAHLMPFLYRLHSSLHLPERWGVWLMGLVALVWMFDCFAGFYLTLPAGSQLPRERPGKGWWRRWHVAWRIKGDAGAFRFNFDLHRAGGLWFWGVLFILGMSGAYFNLNQEVFRPVVGLFGSLTPNPSQALPKRSDMQPVPQLSFEAAIERARALLPEQARGMRPSFIGYLPKQGVYRVGFQQTGRGETAFVLGFEQVFLDADTGQLKGRRGYDSGTSADKFLAWQFPLHSGQILGLPGRVLICITGLVVAMLSVTGVIIWLRKRSARMKSVARHSVAADRCGAALPERSGSG